VSKWGALTVWRVQRKGQVRTRKGSEQVRHSPSGEYKTREVRTRKESELEKGTYMLGNADKRSNEATKRTRASEGHLHTAEHKGRDKLGYKKEASE
jgi:hypothetical protein